MSAKFLRKIPPQKNTFGLKFKSLRSRDLGGSREEFFGQLLHRIPVSS